MNIMNKIMNKSVSPQGVITKADVFSYIIRMAFTT